MEHSIASTREGKKKRYLRRYLWSWPWNPILTFFHLPKYPIEPSPSFSIFSASCVRRFHLFGGRIPQWCIFFGGRKILVCSSRMHENRAGKKQTLDTWTQMLHDRWHWCLLSSAPDMHKREGRNTPSVDIARLVSPYRNSGHQSTLASVASCPGSQPRRRS